MFGNVQKKKEGLASEIKEIQERIEQNASDELLVKEGELLKEFEIVLEQEEVIWFQKSREKWVVHGDRNTKFFHMSTIIRRRRNKVEMLRNNENQWVSEAQELEELAVNYFKKLYSLEDVDTDTQGLLVRRFVSLTNHDYDSLNKTFSAEEVEKAVRGMGSFKAPGPDGFQPVFYQRCWETVGDAVVRFATQFFETGKLPENTNDALVVLIPKVTKPESITQFRPISLCNVLFKTITKAMVGRLKGIMKKLIGPAQASFIPGRLSADNIVVVQEAVHSMRRKKGRKGWMLLKLDLEKAYDRLRWDFLEDTLRAAGLSEVWVGRIMECVAGPSMCILWNGEKTEPFKPSRGLRQGDPLSPYLFVLCMERLCHLIDEAVEEKRWKPINLSRGGPQLSHICFADDLILFAEASLTQIRVIREVLEKFCKASGQKVSLPKSKFFFSSNVTRERGERISRESGIASTRDLGKYLGMPILQKRINKDTFGEVLEKVASRLSGWKKQTLSLAGRVTMTKAVLSSIPVHSMSTIILPVSTLEKLDSLSRSFVWGSGQHLVSWEKVCKPKTEGGLGIRKSRDMNKALIAKVGWRLLYDTESLWARVLRSKYKVSNIHDLSWTGVRSNGSSTWRSLALGIREVVAKGHSWVIGNGREIKFWTDRWLSNQPLMIAAIGGLPEGYEEVIARDMWVVGGGWDLPRIAPFVAEETRQELAAVVVDTVTETKDRLAWSQTKNGQFTVKSGYELITRDDTPRQNMESLFRSMWRVVVPERVKIFLWLVGNHAIMTNAERYRRHLSGTDVCQVCKGGIETILHVIRDCPAIRGIWDRFVPAARRHTFFSMPLLEWLYKNLSDNGTGSETPWSSTFALTVWWGWKWRCRDVFGEKRLWRDRIGFLKNLAKEVILANETNKSQRSVEQRIEIMVGWMPPRVGWMKMNTDGSSHGNPGPAAAGGVLRNGEGEWCGGFAVNIGRCGAPLAELWGVYYGLVAAWEKGIGRLEFEVDSKEVVEFLTIGIGDTHPLSFLVRMCHGFLNKDWEVHIVHVYREANRLADGLANLAFSLPFGFHRFDEVPIEVAVLLQEDVVGPFRPRQVIVN